MHCMFFSIVIQFL